MRRPMGPPSWTDLLQEISTDPAREGSVTPLLTYYQGRGGIAREPYRHWDEIRYRTPPDGLSHEEWWLATKSARQAMQRPTGLQDVDGRAFTYALPDVILRELEFITANASGHIGVNEQVTNPATRDRYLVNSLIEEAITSSQLEGAATTRQVARDMLRSGRRPRTRDERMILNNFQVMQRIGDLRHERLTPDLIRDLHRIVTEGTLSDDSAAGRFQRPDEERVGVYSTTDELLHRPPPAEQLPERIERLCDFANGDLDNGYLPAVLRALTVHFAIAYEHPFEDGNGRTARALFYWSMLSQGFWLTEFLTVSRILKMAPSKYARSFLYTETDDSDLTYFFVYQLEVLHRAIVDLHAYLDRKASELRNLRSSFDLTPDELNHRQIAVLQHAIENPLASFTVQSHKTSHGISTETARQDLLGLEELGLLRRAVEGKKAIFASQPDIAGRLERLHHRAKRA